MIVDLSVLVGVEQLEGLFDLVPLLLRQLLPLLGFGFVCELGSAETRVRDTG